MTILGGDREAPAEQSLTARRNERLVDIFLLAGVGAITLALRVPGLTSNDFYRDDAWPALAARTGLGKAVRLGVTTPGFELLARAWLGIDRSTWFAQLPALVASLVTVLGVYLLARRLGCRPAAAVIGAGILAVSPMGIIYATRFKPYSFDALWALATIAAALWVWADPEDSRRWAALVGLAVAAAIFSASAVPVGAGCIGACALGAWTRARGRRLAAIAAGAFVAFVSVYALMILPSVPPSLHRLWDTGFIDWSDPFDAPARAVELLDDLMAGLVYRHGALNPLLLLAIVFTCVWRRRDVAAVCLVPGAIALALAAAGKAPLGGGRTDLYLYPGLALAAAVAVDAVVAQVRSRLAGADSALTVAALVAVAGFALTTGRQQVRMHPYPGPDLERLASEIAARRGAGDGVVISPYTRYSWAFREPRPVDVILSSKYATGFTVASRDPDEFIMPAEYVEDGYDPSVAVPFAADRARVWYVVTDTPLADTPAEAQAHEHDAEAALVASGFEVADRIDVDGAHADLLVRPLPAPLRP